jgi:hypothetical protein
MASDKLKLVELSPCGPDIAPDEPEDLVSMERAVEDHVAGAPQSDDLTMVFLAAK